jgi:hypothetical protein
MLGAGQPHGRVVSGGCPGKRKRYAKGVIVRVECLIGAKR